ncbi:MAG TPA: IPT/TIG domain-containing protein [Ginsengibacter sp.]
MKSLLLRSGLLICLICIFTGCKKNKTAEPSGPPTVTGVSNTVAGIGYHIIVAGTNFSTNISNNTVSINGVAGIVTSASSNQLAVVFTNAVTGKISITVNGNTASADIDTRIINLSVSTLAGSGVIGSDNGAGNAASFNGQWGCAMGANNNLYVADSYNHEIRKIAFDGTVSTVAGKGNPGNQDGAVGSATFNYPFGIVVDKNGNIYVSEIGSDNIRKITPDGMVSTFAGSPTGRTGSNDGADTSASFNDPLGLATDADGNIYVADAANNKIRKITPAGIVTTVAGTGTAGAGNGTALSASFNTPLSVAIDGSNNLYVTEQKNYDIRKIATDGTVTTVAGSGQAGSADGAGTSAGFNYPVGIVADLSGNLYVTDNGYGTIRIITSSGFVATLAGNGNQASTDGIGYQASFNNPLGMAMDSGGNLYVMDNSSNKVRKVTVQ